MDERTILIQGCDALVDICGSWDAREIIRNTGYGDKEAARLLAVMENVKNLLDNLAKGIK